MNNVAYLGMRCDNLQTMHQNAYYREDAQLASNFQYWV